MAENIRFADLAEEMGGLVELVRTMPEFEFMPGKQDRPSIPDQIESAIQAFEQGKEGLAVRLGMDAKKALQLVAAAYVRTRFQDFSSAVGDSKITDKLRNELRKWVGEKRTQMQSLTPTETDKFVGLLHEMWEKWQILVNEEDAIIKEEEEAARIRAEQEKQRMAQERAAVAQKLRARLRGDNNTKAAIA